MTAPTPPDPNNPPSRIEDWPSWNAAQMRALYGELVIDHKLTLDACFDRYAQVTNELVGLNKYFIQRLAETKVERDDAARQRPTLDEHELTIVEIVTEHIAMPHGYIIDENRVSDTEAQALLDIIARLTAAAPQPTNTEPTTLTASGQFAANATRQQIDDAMHHSTQLTADDARGDGAK